MTTRKTSQKTAKTTLAETATSSEPEALPPANPPPKVNAPSVPKGWKKAKWAKPKGGARLKRAQVDNATTSAGELAKSTTYVEDFGNKAPAAAGIAASLTTAASWRDSWVAATAWLAYCSDQRRLWEEDALTKLAALKPAFDYASVNDASIAKKYPATKQLLGAPSVIAERGATVRKAHKEAEETETTEPPPTASPATTH